MAEDMDDETGQVLHGMDSLPPVLKRYVREDNRWFQQQLREWEEQYCQTHQDEPQILLSFSPTNTEEPASESQHKDSYPTPKPEKEPKQPEVAETEAEAAQEPEQDSAGQIIFHVMFRMMTVGSC